ncbi:MAG TPA: hypothetical protein VIW23_02625 [Candidatus Acidoferrum sp.]
MIQTLLDYYRLPTESLARISQSADSSSDIGYFQFGTNNICYGRSQSGVSPDVAGSSAFDVFKEVRSDSSGTIQLPFSFAEVVQNLRMERYRQKGTGGLELFAESEPVRMLYYMVRKGLPFRVRRQLQKIYFGDWRHLQFPTWPVDFTVDNLHEQLLRLLIEASGGTRMPFIWFWPDGAPNALILTHDVETSAGRDFTFNLMDLDDSFGFKASYQVIPEKRYQVRDEYVFGIRNRGCEFNIHDLNHDGHLYRERTEFERRAAGINGYLKRYHTNGFRAGAMYRKQDWYDVFEFSYDMSVPNVAHLEPLRGGCCTVMPYFIGKIVELPLTTTQDYSLFHILDDYSIDLWKLQLDLIRKRNGLMSLLTHPDYLIEPRARGVYASFLGYLQRMIAHEKIWAALPGEVDRWWRARNAMKLVPSGDTWEIVGAGKERARLAYAVLENGRLSYRVQNAPDGHPRPTE